MITASLFIIIIILLINTWYFNAAVVCISYNISHIVLVIRTVFTMSACIRDISQTAGAISYCSQHEIGEGTEGFECSLPLPSFQDKLRTQNTPSLLQQLRKVFPQVVRPLCSVMLASELVHQT